jgi:Icc-related predicted phosphoesterase
MRIVCISDTHNREISVPDGDLLIHAGDATMNGTPEEIREFNAWFSALPHEHKIFIAGNHDWLFETQPAAAQKLLDESVIYLQDSGANIDGHNIYGSPWQPRFYDWAFNLNRGSEMAEKWELIPAQTDILITHGPPNRILDFTMQGDHAGCEELIKKVEEIRPRVHIFGHIHEGYGTLEKSGTRFVNASNCDEGYRLVNPPIVFEL